MSHIGNFGHSAILLPASLIIIFCLIWYDRRADAVAFGAGLVVCLVATLLAKLAFYACEPKVPPLGIESPSGHASFSAVFYGCVSLLAAAERPLWQRLCVYVSAALFVALVATSRVFVGVHTVPDVIIGIGIGAASIVAFRMLRGPPRAIYISVRMIGLGIPVSAVSALAILVFARQWTPEEFIQNTAGRLDHWLNLCTPI